MKKIKRRIVIGGAIAAAILTGCRFDPAGNQPQLVYGPANITDVGPAGNEFRPEEINPPCVYGPPEITEQAPGFRTSSTPQSNEPDDVYGPPLFC